MANIKIKTASLPKRCEVCHKSDCFDPLRDCCTRCLNNVALVQPLLPLPAKLSSYRVGCPTSIQLIKSSGATQIAYDWGSGNVLVVRLFMLVSIALIFIDPKFALLALFALLVNIYAFAGFLINQTNIIIDAEQIIVSYGRLSLKKELRIPQTEIKKLEYNRFFCVDSISLILNDGRKVRLVMGIDAAKELRFIEQIIRPLLAS